MAHYCLWPIIVCGPLLDAAQDSAGCQQALSRWQRFRQTQLSLTFANNIAWSERDAMQALVGHGFIVARSIRLENRENPSQMPSLLSATAKGFLYDVDGFAVRLTPVNLQDPEQEGRRRIYIRFRGNLYSADVSMNHPNLVAFRESLEGQAQDQAIAQALSQPAFRSAGVLSSTSPISFLPAGSGLDTVLKQQIELLIANPTKDAKGLDLAKLLAFAFDPRIFEYRHFEGGKFMMGSPNSEPGRWDNEGPQREVELSPFDLGNDVPQWAVIIWRLANNKLRNGSDLLLSHFSKEGDSDGDFLDLGQGVILNGNHPGDSLTYFEAEELAAWLNSLPGVRESGCRYGIPSQAQRQYAIRYLGPGKMSYGPRPFPESRLGDFAIFSGNSGGRMHATGQKLPHPNGLLDLFGNSWNWTRDGWTENLNALPRELDPVVIASSENSLRVVVGGSYRGDAGHLRSAIRLGVSSGERYRGVSARLVRHCQ